MMSLEPQTIDTFVLDLGFYEDIWIDVINQKTLCYFNLTAFGNTGYNDSPAEVSRPTDEQVVIFIIFALFDLSVTILENR